MTFLRRATDKWRDEIPGVRWFRADLQVHAAADRSGNDSRLREAPSGGLAHYEDLVQYARVFLRALIDRGIQVVGLTPPLLCSADDCETGAVWSVVDEWNAGIDEDGEPYRDKIYAVFPGFQPSFRDGERGLELLFLFDPEIGRERYLNAFQLLMGGMPPRRNYESPGKTFRDILGNLRDFWTAENRIEGGEHAVWDYLVLAPHVESKTGLLRVDRAEELLPEISGLQLGDDRMPEDALRSFPWLEESMERCRQGFFHASGACDPENIGRRYAWAKLASPRVEALRQAFVASDSRMRIGFGKDGVSVRETDGTPDVALNGRPWLKEIRVRGGASFFGGKEGGELRETRFRLSPDFTCVVGGSMTGKSAFLDGLRIHAGAPLPDDDAIREQVEARGKLVFGAGFPDVAVECPGADPAASFGEQWPAQFFSQNELQRLSQDRAAVEEILARLLPSETAKIADRAERLRNFDERLVEVARNMDKLDDQLEDAEQACDRARNARRELDAFSGTGVESLHRMGRERRLWTELRQSAEEIRQSIRDAAESANVFKVPQVGESLAAILKEADVDKLTAGGRWRRIADGLGKAEREAQDWGVMAAAAVEALTDSEVELRAEVEKSLAERGFDAARLEEIQDLNRRSSLLPSYEANCEQVRKRRTENEGLFVRLLQERRALVEEQRDAFQRVVSAIEEEFRAWIRVRRMDDRDRRPLDRFFEDLRQRGIMRWWDGLPQEEKPSPEALIRNLEARSLRKVGMSETVEEKFHECVTRSLKRKLAALRCPDRYELELRMPDGSYRRLDRLSGGQRVSVLLSLLLETGDDRPLVIDQPEDELDKRFLLDTVLPALKRLKGRRQVIVATHDASIVVNGDADMVIELEATAYKGRVVSNGAIEEPAVRDAVVRAVDGGEEAFRLRRRKYGF